jgi:hypothetical protein
LRDIPEGNVEELALIVGERTRPIGAAERSGISANVDRVISRLMAIAMPTSFAV